MLARWHALEAAQAERNVASGAFLPRLDLTAGKGREERDDPLPQQTYNRQSTSLTLTQLLYDGFAVSNDVKRLGHARMVRLYELYDTSEAVALEVVRAFVDVQRFRKLVALAEENYVRHRAVFEQIQRKALAGVARRVDLEQVSGRLALAEANLLTETSNLHDVSARFQRLVGAPPKSEMEEPPALTRDLPKTIVDAITASRRAPALLAAMENVRSADASARIRNAAFQPRFDVRIRSDRGTNLGGVIGQQNSNSAEVVMSWNLFNGMSDRSRIRQYAEQLNVARDQRDKTCRDIRQTLTIAYNDTRKLAEQLTYLDQHQLAIEKAREAYRNQFDIGQRTLLDVLDSENELFQAKRAYINAEYDLSTAYARTHAGMGNLTNALGLSRHAAGQLPDLDKKNGSYEAIDGCAVEAPPQYVADKAALNLRAQELLKESAPVSSPPASPIPSTVTIVPRNDVANGRKAVIEALKGWTTAWSNRNIQAYLGMYAPTFRPATGISRDEWIAQRKAVLERTGQISIEISDIKIVMKDARKAVTSFQQNYRSESYQDSVYKTLEWEAIGGRWLISREIVETPAPADR
ncbi:MAG: hypothetical protein A3I66_03315 [Burkholderiales bacterium RIFCSPLOWO2_02_FULL_57_36]|nr:MAG: hypothetical protein A3I66_03315 [Burkholderiales bacterium RIFCSPLOWO2_02_FULL_57_36]